MIGRLPPLALGKDCCRLPLSEPTASALLSALLESQSHERRAILAEALALDPALALWGGRHFAAPSPAQAVPAIFTLASWLEEKLPLLLAPAKRADNDRHDPTTLPVDRIYFAKLAAADVAAAEATTGDILNDPLYLVTLLRSAPDWLTAGGCAGEGAGIAAGWLGECSRMLLHPAGESRADGSVATADDPFAAPAPHSLLPGTGRSSAARQRWLEPPGFASQHFTLVAARLARLDDFERRFDAKLEEEKMAALVEFAAGAGHEINNPLAVISGRAQLFLRHEPNPERRRELAVINGQARRVHEMIADLMLFARPPQPRLAECDMGRLIDRIVAELAPRAAQQGVELSFAGGRDLPALEADATQLEVALRAVCENALDALESGGRVEISAALQDAPTARHVAITIRDNGPGMSSEVRRHAFDPFFSGSGAGRGLGFGLSKCWRIVREHGGRVDIDSGASGTSVTILLPAVMTIQREQTSQLG